MIEQLKASKAGFTLVELIVVIAILAILAGVSIPVYSGYIDKAGLASDLQLLSAVNTAFTAACAEIGEDPTGLVGLAALTGETGAKTITSVSAVGGGMTPEKLERLSDAFFTYYGDNKDTAFRKLTSLGYDRANGVFVDGDTEYSYYDTTTGKTLTVSYGDLTAYTASTFGQMDASVLTGAVDDLVSRVLINTGESIGQSLDGFSEYLKELGISAPDTTGMSDEQRAAAIADWRKQQANALVLFTASAADQVNASDMFERIQEGYTADTGASGNQYVAEVAGLYSLMTAYANSPYAADTTITDTVTIPLSWNGVEYNNKIKDYYQARFRTWDKNNVSKSTDSDGNVVYTITGAYSPTAEFNSRAGSMVSPLSVIEMYDYFSDTDSFQEYLQSQGQADLNAYFSALSIIDENTGNVDLNNVLTNGFTDGGIANLVAAVTGG